MPDTKTLLIIAAVAVVAYMLWKKGVFNKPTDTQDAA